jgi:tetratricopeptide (TPR) repeat protein
MMFVADAFTGWLLGQLLNASRTGLSRWLGGRDEQRALQQAAKAAIQATARELRPRSPTGDDAQSPEHLARVIDQVFQQPPTPAEAMAGQVTLLQGLQQAVATRLAVLGEADITGTGRSSAELLGIEVPAVAEALTRHLLREILLAGAGGGPLTPLAAQLNHDLTQLQGQQHTAQLLQLTEEIQAALAALSHRDQSHREATPIRPQSLGRPLEEVTDPFALEVHRAITVATTTGPLPELPAYIERDHDRSLRGIVARAADGHSAAAVLVGGSSTGKTRACWEAIQRLPHGWRLWHPIDPSRPEAAAQAIGGVSSRTVIWLNEAHHYLLTPASRLGERIAAGLRELLRDPNRSPVLVLGTIWPDFWAVLTTPPGAGEWDDPHAQARALLTGSDIAVPDAFTGPALRAAQAAARADPRLAEAVDHAQDGRITQFLAGVPALLERYRNAPAAARALIEAAMDARRLGHGPYLPLRLLEAAAPGYLSDQEWDGLDDSWLERALAYCAAPSRGAPGPLTRVRARPGQPPPATARVRLADYLEQAGRVSRRAVLAAAALWDGLVEHADQRDLPRLAGEAEARSLYRYALALHLRAAAAGDVRALRQAAALLRWADQVDEAVGLYQRAAEAGDPSALGEAALLLEGAGRIDEAVALYQQAAQTGQPFARWRAVDLLSSAGRLDEAIEWLQRSPADSGDLGSRRQMAELLLEAGRTDEAIRLYQRAAEAGDLYALGRATQLLHRAGRTDDAIGWLQSRVTDTDDHSLRQQATDLLAWVGSHPRSVDQPATQADKPDVAGQAAELLVEAGRVDLAIGLYQRIARAGDRSALWRAAELLERTSQLEDAIAFYQSHAEPGDLYASSRVVELLRQSDQADAAIDWLQSRALAAGDRAAMRAAAELLQEIGRREEAIDWYQRAVEAGDRTALWQMTALLPATGGLDDAIEPYLPAAEAGDRDALEHTTRLLQASGGVEEAVALYLRAAEAGDPDALLCAADLLERAGRHEEAAALRRYGLEPGGRVASRWR